MRLLLDSCTFLWLIWDEAPLTLGVRELLEDGENTLYLSVISIWEATVKHAKGRLDLKTREPAWQHLTGQRAAHGISPLPVDEAVIAHLEHLPDLHRDPFDRLLICQAIEHGLAIVTPDQAIRQYPVKTLWR